ncbi:MAG: carbohydrate-binding domain-containing protein, partial [Oscillospiraceae bacterium]|nr:carbohydrate-binding domain-containing protein [Oscillospiraceae bacterium]
LAMSMTLTGCSFSDIDESVVDSLSTMLGSLSESDSGEASDDSGAQVSNLSLSANAPYSMDPTSLFTERDLSDTYEVTTEITLNDDSASVSGEGASADGSTVTVTGEGVYRVTGKLTDGRIVVNAPDAKVQIVLDGAEITSSDGSAIMVESAKKVFLTLADGSENTVSDGKTYADTADGSPDAAIYSKETLTINGSGSLNVNGNYNEGITSKDELVITGGTIRVTSTGNGIKGKDHIAVCGGDIQITSGGDGMKATNNIDAGMGFVFIGGGTITIDAQEDGIQAETELVLEGGTLDITSGGGSENAPAHTGDFMGGAGGIFGGRGNFDRNAENTDGTQQFGGKGGFDRRNHQNTEAQTTEAASEPSGTPTVYQTANMTQPTEGAPDGELPSENTVPSGEQIPNGGQLPQDGQMPANGQAPANNGQIPDNAQVPANNGQIPDNAQTAPAAETDSADTTDTVSIKGLKAGTLLYIGSGEIKVNAADDALHSNQALSIAGGTIELQAGSKGVHADTTVDISGGTLHITESYEGIEAADITVSGGNLVIKSSDDGFNASDGSAEGAMGRAVSASLTISGGEVTVDAGGDGLDSNGDLTVSGGTVYVNGPTNAGNGALDSNNSLSCTGGTLIAVGASGMAEYPDGTQETIVLTTTETQSANTEVVITDASGNVIATFTPTKTWNSFIISTPDLKTGETYSFTLNGAEAGSVTLDETVSFIGEAGGMMGGGMMGGRGGMGGGQMPDGGNFDPENLPDDFDPSQMTPPDGGNFDPANLPEDFDPSQMTPPDGGSFDPSQMQSPTESN